MSLGRIRTIKPENWSDEAIGSVSREARLLRDVLITLVDDDGRWRHLPSAVIGHGYPYDDDVSASDVRRLADELHAAGVIHLYEVDGVAYGCFPKWHSHQVINKYKASTLPAPKDVRCSRRSTRKPGFKGSDEQTDSGRSTGGLRESDGSPTAPLPEGSRPDQEIRAPDPVPDPFLVEDACASVDAKLLSDVVAVLRTCKRFTFDPMYAGVANMLAAHPSCDHMEAAHTAAARGADPSYRTTIAARAFEYALLDQVKRRPTGKPALSAVPSPEAATEAQALADQIAFRKKMEAAADAAAEERRRAS